MKDKHQRREHDGRSISFESKRYLIWRCGFGYMVPAWHADTLWCEELE
jgi:hypothetical protein